MITRDWGERVGGERKIKRTRTALDKTTPGMHYQLCEQEERNTSKDT